MKINTVKQRLKLYKKALKDFEKELSGINDMKDTLDRNDSGFCTYFYINESIVDISTLPELYKQKPKKGYKSIYKIIERGKIKTLFHRSYWYKPTNIKIRIRDLKRAVANCEQKINPKQ